MYAWHGPSRAHRSAERKLLSTRRILGVTVRQLVADGGSMRRFTTTLALALSLLSCGVFEVQLLTGTDPRGCYAGGEGQFEGLLVAGGEYGTTLNGKPVMWPVGWTGRRVGFEVEVLDGAGTVRAITGRRYRFAVGPIPDPENAAKAESLGAAVVAACDWQGESST